MQNRLRLRKYFRELLVNQKKLMESIVKETQEGVEKLSVKDGRGMLSEKVGC